MQKTKIEWCDYTWNPVSGCLHNCEYCYARVFSRRFSGDVRLNLQSEQCKEVGNGIYELESKFINEKGNSLQFPFGFAPTFHKYRLSKPEKLKTKANIFVGSVTDLFGDWVPDEWIDKVFDAAKANPQHNYLFLTKNPRKYYDLFCEDRLCKGDNFWYGISMTNRDGGLPMMTEHNLFISCEPLLEDIAPLFPLYNFYRYVNWVIIGAETGNRKGKVIPTPGWINDIVSYCDEHNIPVFMKDSLIPIVGEDNMRREFPPELLRQEYSAKNKARYVTTCAECGRESNKNTMTAIIEKKGRRGKAETFGYVCDSCIDKFNRRFK